MGRLDFCAGRYRFALLLLTVMEDGFPAAPELVLQVRAGEVILLPGLPRCGFLPHGEEMPRFTECQSAYHGPVSQHSP